MICEKSCRIFIRDNSKITYNFFFSITSFGKLIFGCFISLTFIAGHWAVHVTRTFLLHAINIMLRCPEALLVGCIVTVVALFSPLETMSVCQLLSNEIDKSATTNCKRVTMIKAACNSSLKV